MHGKTITIILVLTVIGGIAWYFNRTYLTSDTGKESLKPGNSSSSVEVSANLVFATSAQAREIWQINSQKEIKKLFTDVNETDKILKISNVNSQGEVLLIMGKSRDSATGKLVGLNLGNPKPKVYQENFALPDIFRLSNDGQKFVYTRFSNVEENYGFTLYMGEKNGQLKTPILTSETNITSPSWSSNDSKIAFSVMTADKAELKIVNLSNNQESLVASFTGKIIDSLAFLGEEALLYSLRDLNAASGQIYRIDIDGQREVKIEDFNGGIANFLTPSADLKIIGYLIAQYKNNLNETTSGQIYMADILNKQTNPLGKGVQILGWKND